MHLVVLGLSIFIGLFVGVLGGGGSIMTTPLLIYVVGMPTVDAIASSLLIVAAISLIALIQHAIRGFVQWRTGIIFGSAGVVSAFFGGQVGARLPGQILLITFALMMSITGIAMIRGRKDISTKTMKVARTYRIIIDGALVGFVTGLVGAGGGFMVVPALVLFGGLTIKQAIPTSLLVVAMKCLGAFAGYALKFGNGALISINEKISFDFEIIFIAILGAAVGSIIGSLFTNKIDSEKLRVFFGWFVITVAAIIIFEGFIGAGRT